MGAVVVVADDPQTLPGLVGAKEATGGAVVAVAEEAPHADDAVFANAFIAGVVITGAPQAAVEERDELAIPPILPILPIPPIPPIPPMPPQLLEVLLVVVAAVVVGAGVTQALVSKAKFANALELALELVVAMLPIPDKLDMEAEWECVGCAGAAAGVPKSNRSPRPEEAEAAGVVLGGEKKPPGEGLLT